MEHIGRNRAFKARLKSLKVSQIEFARMVGLTYQAVKNALSNRDLPPEREAIWNGILDRYEREQRARR